MDEITQKELQRILQLDVEALTDEEKAFLQARRSYLNKRQLREFRPIFKDCPDVDFGDVPGYDDEPEKTTKAPLPKVEKVEKTDTIDTTGSNPKTGVGKLLSNISKMVNGDEDHDSDPDYHPKV